MDGKVFIKPHGEVLSDELQRLACLQQICASTGLARTAAVLGVDAPRHSICYEYLDGLIPLSLAAGQENSCFRALGILLARLHLARPAMLDQLPRDIGWECRQLELAGIGKEMTLRLLDAFPAGFSHGDCWHGNVLRQGAAWVVLDPLPSGLILQGIGGHASGIFDLANMHMSFFACRNLRHFFQGVGRQTCDYGQALLDGYLDGCGCAWARPAVLQLSRALALQWGRWYSQRLAMPVAFLKQQMLIRNFKDYYAGEYEAP